MTVQEQALNELPTSSPFHEQWMKSEGVPVYRGYYIEDLNKLKLEPWSRKGGNGCFILLEGSEGSTDGYVSEIEPGRNLKAEKHLFEEMVLILQGRGATSIWNPGGPPQTFEWQEGSLFAIPLNAWHQHFNGQGDKPVRFLGATNAPVAMNLYHNLDFIFDNSFVFKDRYNSEQGYFSNQGILWKVPGQTVRAWESNFIPDVRIFKTYELKERGGAGSSVIFEMAGGTMAAHISEFATGCYKKAHRHAPGANIIMVSGEGYSLMWLEGQEKVTIPWHASSLFVPPGDWFHQHFNTGREPARYVALKYTGSRKYPLGRSYRSLEDVKKGGDQIEYEDEDPGIRSMYEKDLKKKGLEMKMGRAK